MFAWTLDTEIEARGPKHGIVGYFRRLSIK